MSNLKGEQRFELKRHLADTLQGRIYLAVDKTTGSTVIVKETWDQLIRLHKSREGHRVAEDFEKEKEILNYLSSEKDCHPGFAKILDEWKDDLCHFYAMEYCPHGDLFEYVKNMHMKTQISEQQKLNKPLEIANEWIKTVQHIFRQLVDCVSWLHKKNVFHLDLSLENAMMYDGAKQLVKIIDFGLAVHSNEPKYDKRVGKTGYMAPEVYAKVKYDLRKADIWSLGVMLFMMLIGAPPYQFPTSANPSFQFIINGNLRAVLSHWNRLGYVTEDALDLMNKIFQLEDKRLNMEDIINHPFVRLNSEPLYSTQPTTQADVKELLDDKVEEVSNEPKDNNFNDNQLPNTPKHTQAMPIPHAVVIAGHDHNVDAAAVNPNDNNVTQPHGDPKNLNGRKNSQGNVKKDSPITPVMQDDNKNDDTMDQANEVGNSFNISNRQYETNEAKDFRNRILNANDDTNKENWRRFLFEIATIITNKQIKPKQPPIQNNECRDGEFPPEGIEEDEESQLEREIEELEELRLYVESKAN